MSDAEYDVTKTDAQGYGSGGYFHFRIFDHAGEQVQFNMHSVDRMDDDTRLVYNTEPDTDGWQRFDEPLGTNNTFTQTFEDNEVYISNCLPYPYQRTVDYAESLAVSEYVELEHIGTTGTDDRDQYVIRMTDSEVPRSEKQDIVLLTREHPGETNGSYHMEGMLDYALDVFEDDVREFEQDYVIHAYPHANADGIYRGIHYLDPQGNDYLRNTWWEDNPPDEVENFRSYVLENVEEMHWGFNLHCSTNPTYNAISRNTDYTDEEDEAIIENIEQINKSYTGFRDDKDWNQTWFAEQFDGAVMVTTEVWTYHDYTPDENREEGRLWFQEITNEV